MPKNTLAIELRSIRAALRQLERSVERLARVLAATEATGVKQPRRKLRLTQARRASLKLQGQYMGYMRGLKPAQKSKVKKIHAKKGIRAAIAAARRLAS